MTFFIKLIRMGKRFSIETSAMSPVWGVGVLLFFSR